MQRIVRFLFPAIAITPFVLGCSGAPPGPTVVPVSGTVTLDGKALSGALVTFQPQQPKVNPSVGTTNAEGKYELTHGTSKGAVPGSYTVTVAYYVLPDGKPFQQQQEGMDIEQMVLQGKVVSGLPARYNDAVQTPLKADVSADKPNNAVHFELTSK